MFCEREDDNNVRQNSRLRVWNHNRRPGGRGLSHVRIFVVESVQAGCAPLSLQETFEKQLTAYRRALTDCGSGSLADWLQAGTRVGHQSASIGRHSGILRAAEKLGRRDPLRASRWRSGSRLLRVAR